jgi:hypothetical protein
MQEPHFPRDLTEISELRQNITMPLLSKLVLDLIAAGYSTLALILVIAIALRVVGPIHLNLSLGDRPRKSSDDTKCL